ncbi:ATP-binding protein [Halodurantibacterium flavum]|uniref:ATP-binding protein n=1 Tax=Halodurantibacterium flavum TaxID=1382802 RepID=A0ABW4S7W2_9RHOB
MGGVEHLRIGPDLAEVGPAAERIRDLTTTAIGVEGGEAMELAFVEAVNNIILHGHLSPGDRIGIALQTDDRGAVLTLEDRGRPIPPVALQEADEPGDPLAESSRGLWLIRALMHDIGYESADGLNRLTLTRRADTDRP